MACDGTFQQERKHVSEILDFFKVFSGDERFEKCRPVILKEAKKGVVNMRSVMEYAENLGRSEGIREGKIAGKLEGRQEGRQEGKLEQAMKTAHEMIRDGEPMEKIKRYTGLPTEKIEELQKEIK